MKKIYSIMLACLWTISLILIICQACEKNPTNSEVQKHGQAVQIQPDSLDIKNIEP